MFNTGAKDACPAGGQGDTMAAGPTLARNPDRGFPVMSHQYPIQAHTRICAATGRALHAGDKYFSVVLDQDGQLIRRDYAADAWPGAPPDAVAFWTGRVPAVNQKRRLSFDEDLLMECFERLADDADASRTRFRYVVALLLLRRKRLRFEDVHRDQGQEHLQLRCAKSGATFEVLDPRLAEADINTVQEEVFKLLGWD